MGEEREPKWIPDEGKVMRIPSSQFTAATGTNAAESLSPLTNDTRKNILLLLKDLMSHCLFSLSFLTVERRWSLNHLHRVTLWLSYVHYSSKGDLEMHKLLAQRNGSKRESAWRQLDGLCPVKPGEQVPFPSLQALQRLFPPLVPQQSSKKHQHCSLLCPSWLGRSCWGAGLLPSPSAAFLLSLWKQRGFTCCCLCSTHVSHPLLHLVLLQRNKCHLQPWSKGSSSKHSLPLLTQLLEACCC